MQSLLLLAAFLLILLNGFFVAAEFALVKARRTRLRQLAEGGGGVAWSAGLAEKLTGNLDAYLSATQLGITLASIGLGWIGEPALAHLIEPPLRAIGLDNPAAIHGIAFGVAFAIVSFLHIVLGELAPKSIAIRKAETTSLWVAAPLLGFYRLFYPAIVVLNGTANALLRVIGIAPVKEGDDAHSGEELRMILASSHAHGLLGSTERRVAANALQFSTMRVRDIMIPKTRIAGIPAGASLAQCVETALKLRFTRYPVIRPGSNEVVGMINVKDLLALAASAMNLAPPAEVSAIVRPALFIPESATLDRAMRTLQRRSAIMAVVVDERGLLVGLVTMEDIVERLVGDIRDEFGDSRKEARRTPPDIFEGDQPIEVLQRLAGMELPPDHRARTVGGYVVEVLGRVPGARERVTVGGRTFEVLAIDGRRVARVRLLPAASVTRSAGPPSGTAHPPPG